MVEVGDGVVVVEGVVDEVGGVVDVVPVVGLFTFTVTAPLAVPPLPVQVMVKVEVLKRGGVMYEPVRMTRADQAPDAVQEVAEVLLQESAMIAPGVTDEAELVMVTVGAGAGPVGVVGVVGTV